MDRQFVAALSTYGEQLERIAELEQQLAEAQSNNKELVRKNAFLRQRPDLPVDRIPAYEEMKQENERLRSPDLRTLYGYDAGFKAGMERAAELKEQVRVDCSAMPNSSIDAALQHYERAIRAELNR